jgi:hypothetical protein
MHAHDVSASAIEHEADAPSTLVRIITMAKHRHQAPMCDDPGMRHRVASLLIPLALLAACASDIQVGGLQLGRSVNADNTVAHHTTVFKPDETVYVSVLTTGAGSGEIGVRWIYAGRVMGEPKKQISYRGNAATEFHLQNAGGFPSGEYAVEVFFNGQPAGRREFRVETP